MRHPPPSRPQLANAGVAGGRWLGSGDRWAPVPSFGLRGSAFKDLIMLLVGSYVGIIHLKPLSYPPFAIIRQKYRDIS